MRELNKNEMQETSGGCFHPRGIIDKIIDKINDLWNKQD